MKAIRKTVFLIFIIAVISIGVMFLKTNDSKNVKVLGYSALNVMTGSMEPEIKTGSLILIKDILIDDIKVDDVITVRTNNGSLVTHRVANIDRDNEGIYLITKGDANDVYDSFKVRENMIEGKVMFNVPYVGSFMS
ncbi:MAG: signal peptidase I, partial [Clostridium sp.]|uniref:signal peptidase I n=1 Tax=Clostridium sp. TaxID=1506 RepID=UPI003F2A1D29